MFINNLAVKKVKGQFDCRNFQTDLGIGDIVWVGDGSSVERTPRR